MQEDVEQKTVALIIKGVKLTGRGLKFAIVKYLAHLKKQKYTHGRDSPTGKQTVKELVGQGQGVSNIEITDSNIKSFERVARKYGVDYALKKDVSGEIPRYLVFFKARDADALTAAFKEYTAKEVKRDKKPSLDEQLRRQKAKVKPLEHKQHKEMER